MPEKALLVLKKLDGTDGTCEKIVPAHPYDTFFSREVTSVPGPYSNVVAIYCSIDLEKEIRKQAKATTSEEAQKIPLKGLGDLSLEKAAAMHARLDTGLETPHVREADRPSGPADIFACG
jgi:hypothetical protein